MTRKATISKLSILITTKDRQSYIEKQYSHLKYHLRDLPPHLEYEVIFYDDGSENPLTLCTSDPNFKLLRCETNVGLIQARNDIVRHVSSDTRYLFFLDDDLFIYNLAECLRDAVASIDSGYAVVSIPFVDLPTKKNGKFRSFKKLISLSKNSDVEYFFGGACIFKREIFEKSGGLEGIYKIYLEEEDLALRLFSQGEKFKVLYGKNYLGIHDQARDKDWRQRNIYLLSNRMIFHYKFITNQFIRSALNSIYILYYLTKLKSFTLTKEAISRYLAVKSDITPIHISRKSLFYFFVRRYLI